MSDTHVAQRSRIADDLDFHDQCTAAISAHGEWKFKLKKATQNRGEGLDANTIALDNQCVFGKWLYSDATANVRKDKDYDEIRKLHAEFHRTASQVVHLCQSGEAAAAERAIGDESAYAAISAQLIAAIKKWIQARSVTAGREIQAGERGETEAERKISKFAYKTAAIGLAAGVAFVIAAIAITCATARLPFALASILTAHQVNPTIFLIDTALPILGTIAYFIGRFIAQRRYDAESLQLLVDKRTEQLSEQQAESERIFKNLRDGIFTLNHERRIGAKYSASLVDIFEQTEIAGYTLTEIFKGRISTEIERELEGYLDLLYDSAHKESMLEALNPFNPLELAATDDTGIKILSVRFFRMPGQTGAIESVLSIATDITRQTLLHQELAEQQRAASEQMAMIGEIFEIGPEMLSSFRSQIGADLEKVTDMLRNPQGLDFIEALNEIFRTVHSIKGSANLLGLTRIAENAHLYEDRLTAMQKQRDLTEMDFLPLTILHGKLTGEIAAFEQLLEKIRNFQTHATTGGDACDLFKELLRRLVAETAKAQDKQIDLTFAGVSSENCTAQQIDIVRDIFIQLIRNSAAHGIETVADRVAANKPEIGRIDITLVREGNEAVWTYRDDGRGFDIEAIRRRAIERELVREGKAAALSDAAVVQYIFQPGFSTAKSTDMTAGRGMGMDIVREKIRGLNGKLELRWKNGQYSKFIIRMPMRIAS